MVGVRVPIPAGSGLLRFIFECVKVSGVSHHAGLVVAIPLNVGGSGFDIVQLFAEYLCSSQN
jgi:hypothetical protein